MNDVLRIAHLRIAHQGAILRWAILTFTFFFIHQPSRVWICITVNAAGTTSPDQFYSRKIMICLLEDYGVANTVAT